MKRRHIKIKSHINSLCYTFESTETNSTIISGKTIKTMTITIKVYVSFYGACVFDKVIFVNLSEKYTYIVVIFLWLKMFGLVFIDAD